jgi:hypothetical protein
MALFSMPAMIYAVNRLLAKAYRVGDEEKQPDGKRKNSNIKQTFPEDEAPAGRTVQITIR